MSTTGPPIPINFHACVNSISYPSSPLIQRTQDWPNNTQSTTKITGGITPCTNHTLPAGKLWQECPTLCVQLKADHPIMLHWHPDCLCSWSGKPGWTLPGTTMPFWLPLPLVSTTMTSTNANRLARVNDTTNYQSTEWVKKNYVNLGPNTGGKHKYI
jgi:hypothetical protein